MESSVPGRLAGWEIHGFHTMEDLEVKKIMEEATTRWLRPNEIHAILCNRTYFSIYAKPVNLPKSGTIALFDRKMLRNFRKDGHNWKKKNDGKTVKEAHEHLKVGNEERIHVYYARGQDNPNFVRRCYWLLDKKHEHIVLVHYREIIELQGSPVTPLNSNFGSTYSNTSGSMVLSEDTDCGADHACHASSGSSFIGESIDFGDVMTVGTIATTLHEINTLAWEDLVMLNDPNESAEPKKDKGSCFEQQNQYEISDSSGIGNLLQSKNITGASNGSIDARLPTSAIFQILENQTNSDVLGKNFEMAAGSTDESLNMFVKGLQTQDSFGRWMNYIMTDSPGLLDDLPAESPVSTGHESNTSMVMDPESSIQEQIFSITDVSPAWALSTEETKVIVIGYFHGAYSNLAESNLHCVFGDACVPAERVQVGVFRSIALPRTPGLVNFYMSLDGHTPISQICSFEYRSPSMEKVVVSPEDEREEFQVRIRLAYLLFSTTNICNIITRKLPPNSLMEAKKFAMINSSIKNDWANLIKLIENDAITSRQAKNSLLELTLKTKLQEWLLERVVEGSKTTVRDHQGQGVIHLCAILDYTWAVCPYSLSGLSLDFRDAFGWTALHWAAFYGRKKMVAVLLSAGADPSLVTDPTSEFPGGCTAADLASKNGYDGLAAYLAEKGLTAHFRRMSLSGNISGSLQTSTNNAVNPESLNEEQLCLKDMLAAYRNAADAAARIQAAFRERTLKLQTKAVQSAKPEAEACNIIAAMKIQHAFRNYEMRKRMGAAIRIQQSFRTRKIRKDFIKMRQQAIKIQAAFRGHQMRKQYHKILWSVGIVEKAILRWRLKRKGFRGLQAKTTEAVGVDETYKNGVEDFYQISQKQAEERIERSVVRVQALFRSYRAQQEYRRMKLTYDQAQSEYNELFEP